MHSLATSVETPRGHCATTQPVHKGRLEAFSDAVIAIILTIMVLELRPPLGSTSLVALQPLLPTFLTYALSFVYLGIYWNNHHHMLQSATRVSGGVLWANMHLLFWLSLVPFVTAWLGEGKLAVGPVALYGIVLISAGIAYYILSQMLIRVNGHDSPLARAIGRDVKGILSVVIYAVAIGFAFFVPVVSCVLYTMVALMWLIPDRRLEHVPEGNLPAN